MSNLKVEGLKKRIADFTLEADFSVPSGARAVLIGPSGGGKTTLLRVLAGLEASDGRIFLGHEEISGLSPQKRGVGMVFQDAALFPALSVIENAVFGLKMRGVSRDRARAEGQAWLEKVGLGRLVDAPIARLSGGEAQRVAFVRALIWKPRLILLDEPFSALDPVMRETLRSELVELHRLSPAPLVMVSHDAGDAERIATMRLVLDVGQSTRLVKASSNFELPTEPETE